MAEQFKSITDARKELPTLAVTVEDGSDRVVITNQGKPQAVLLGYDDFKGLMAAVELINHPRDLEQLHEGLADKGRMSFDELRARIAARPKEKSVPVEVRPVEGRSMEWIGSRLDTMNERIEQVLRQVKRVTPSTAGLVARRSRSAAGK